MKAFIRNFILAGTLLAVILSGGRTDIAEAAPGDAVPAVNISEKPASDGPFGYFKLVQCDGPAQLNDPSMHTKEPNWRPDPNFVACDFRGLTRQIQFLVNVMIVAGVLGALVSLAYAGTLYATGSKSNVDKAKKMFPKIAWGFIIMLTAWFVIYQLLVWLTGKAAYLSGTI